MSRNEPSLEEKIITHPVVYGSSETQGRILLVLYHLPQSHLEGLIKVLTPAQTSRDAGWQPAVFTSPLGESGDCYNLGAGKGPEI